MKGNELQLVTTKNFDGVMFDCYRDNEYGNDNAFWATREKIGLLLEYDNPRVSIANIHNRNKKRMEKFSRVIKLITHEESRTVTRDVTVYNFKGLLEICRYSNQPNADAVIDKLWDIADEIRQTGMYLDPKTAEAIRQNPEMIKDMLENYQKLERKVNQMEERFNKEYSFMVLGHVVVAQEGVIPFKDGAAFLSQHGIPIGQNRLFKHCRDKKLLCSRKGKQWNKPTQKAIDAGLFNVQISGGFNTITMITPNRLKYLANELIAEKYPLLALMQDDSTQIERK